MDKLVTYLDHRNINEPTTSLQTVDLSQAFVGDPLYAGLSGKLEFTDQKGTGYLTGISQGMTINLELDIQVKDTDNFIVLTFKNASISDSFVDFSFTEAQTKVKGNYSNGGRRWAKWNGYEKYWNKQYVENLTELNFEFNNLSFLVKNSTGQAIKFTGGLSLKAVKSNKAYYLGSKIKSWYNPAQITINGGFEVDGEYLESKITFTMNNASEFVPVVHTSKPANVSTLKYTKTKDSLFRYNYKPNELLEIIGPTKVDSYKLNGNYVEHTSKYSYSYWPYTNYYYLPYFGGNFESFLNTIYISRNHYTYNFGNIALQLPPVWKPGQGHGIPFKYTRFFNESKYAPIKGKLVLSTTMNIDKIGKVTATASIDRVDYDVYKADLKLQVLEGQDNDFVQLKVTRVNGKVIDSSIGNDEGIVLLDLEKLKKLGDDSYEVQYGDATAKIIKLNFGYKVTFNDGAFKIL